MSHDLLCIHFERIWSENAADTPRALHNTEISVGHPVGNVCASVIRVQIGRANKKIKIHKE